MRLVFLHGAGGYEEDRPLADGIGAQLGASVELPRMPDQDMSFETWAGAVRRSLAAVGPDDFVMAHSFGASILLRVLTEGSRIPRRAVLLAMPDWGPEGWNVAEYAFAGPEPATRLSLHHCRDDEIVPSAHLVRNATRLPSARVHEYPVGGHQFDGAIESIAADAMA